MPEFFGDGLSECRCGCVSSQVIGPHFPLNQNNLSACSIRPAVTVYPRYSNIILAASIAALGLTTFLSAETWFI
jgi:hypothetical protein